MGNNQSLQGGGLEEFIPDVAGASRSGSGAVPGLQQLVMEYGRPAYNQAWAEYNLEHCNLDGDVRGCMRTYLNLWKDRVMDPSLVVNGVQGLVHKGTHAPAIAELMSRAGDWFQGADWCTRTDMGCDLRAEYEHWSASATLPADDSKFLAFDTGYIVPQKPRLDITTILTVVVNGAYRNLFAFRTSGVERPESDITYLAEQDIFPAYSLNLTEVCAVRREEFGTEWSVTFNFSSADTYCMLEYSITDEEGESLSEGRVMLDINTDIADVDHGAWPDGMMLFASTAQHHVRYIHGFLVALWRHLHPEG